MDWTIFLNNGDQIYTSNIFEVEDILTERENEILIINAVNTEVFNEKNN